MSLLKRILSNKLHTGINVHRQVNKDVHPCSTFPPFCGDFQSKSVDSVLASLSSRGESWQRPLADAGFAVSAEEQAFEAFRGIERSRVTQLALRVSREPGASSPDLPSASH